MERVFEVKVDLRRVPAKIKQIVHDPRVLHELAYTWNEKFKEFMPYSTGELQNSAEITSDGYITYDSPYAHYYYVGDEYVYSMERDEATGDVVKKYFAPAGEKKFPSGDLLVEQPNISPNYTNYWDKFAYQVYKEEVAEHMTKFIEGL